MQFKAGEGKHTYILGVFAFKVLEQLTLRIGDKDLDNRNMPGFNGKMQRCLASHLVWHIEIVIQQILIQCSAHLAIALLARIQLRKFDVRDYFQYQLSDTRLIILCGNVHCIVATAFLQACGRIAATD